MDKALVRYIDNGLTRYDGKEYIETVSKLHRHNSPSGPLKAGETIIDQNCLYVADGWGKRTYIHGL